MIYDCPKHIRLTDGHGWIHTTSYQNGYNVKPRPLERKKIIPVPDTENRKEAVYIMRQAGATYDEIAEKLNISVSNAYGLYSKYCHDIGMVLRSQVSIKEQAYNLAKQGLTEDEIGKRLDRTALLIRQYVSRYSAERGVKNPFIRPKPKTKGQTAYELRSSGMTYKQVGATMDGLSDQAARSLVVAYARSKGLDIPRIVR